MHTTCRITALALLLCSSSLLLGLEFGGRSDTITREPVVADRNSHVLPPSSPAAILSARRLADIAPSSVEALVPEGVGLVISLGGIENGAPFNSPGL